MARHLLRRKHRPTNARDSAQLTCGGLRHAVGRCRGWIGPGAVGLEQKAEVADNMLDKVLARLGVFPCTQWAVRLVEPLPVNVQCHDHALVRRNVVVELRAIDGAPTGHG